jgi:hypothetical protein
VIATVPAALALFCDDAIIWKAQRIASTISACARTSASVTRSPGAFHVTADSARQAMTCRPASSASVTASPSRPSSPGIARLGNYSA